MKKSNWAQPLIGIALLLFLIIPMTAWELTNNSGNGFKVAGMMVAGTFLGYSLSRARFGFTGPIKKITQNGDGRQAKALIYLFMICSIIAGAAMIGLPNAFGYPLKTSTGVGTIIGGLLFGGGMLMATGCASGTLTDIGDGMVPAILVLAFFMLGSVFGVVFYGSAADIDFTNGNGSSIAKAVGSMSLGVIINLVLLAIILGIVVIIHKWRALRGTQILTPMPEGQKIDDLDISTKNKTLFEGFFTYKTWLGLFKKRWTWMMGVFAIAIWFAIIAVGFKTSPGITGAYARWGIAITHGFGIDKSLHWGGMWGEKGGPLNMMHDAQSWQNIGIITGALAAKLFANEFSFVGAKNQKWHNWILYAFGGMMMGLGARVARGCNFGALFTGITYGTGFGWIFGISLTLGATGMSMLIKVMRHETPDFVYKIKRKRK